MGNSHRVLSPGQREGEAEAQRESKRARDGYCFHWLEDASKVVAIGTTPALITAHVLSEVPADIFASAFAASDCSL